MKINGIYDRTGDDSIGMTLEEYFSQFMVSDGDNSGALAEIMEITAPFEESDFVQNIRKVSNYTLGFAISIRLPKFIGFSEDSVIKFIQDLYDFMWSETVIIDPGFFYRNNPDNWSVVSTSDYPKISVCKYEIHDKTVSIAVVLPYFIEGNSFSFLTAKRIQTRLYGALSEC